MEQYSEHIKKLRSALEAKLQWGYVGDWHSSMFTELSKKIFDTCQVMLSTATLKRFFGIVNHEGNPSVSTLDTLSQFVGFENWRAFKLAQPESPKSNRFTFQRKSLYVTAGFFMAIMTVMLIAYTPQHDPNIIASISFSSRPVTNTYPNSVVFDFNLKGIQSDSIHIQQYWDPTKTINVRYDQTQATGIYYFPGYFRAKLLVDGNIVKEHDLFLRSNGWIGTIDYEPVPKYFEPLSNTESFLLFPDGIEKEIQLSDQPLVSTLHYIDDLGDISGDDFKLNARIQSTYHDKWAVCQTSWIYILGTKGAMIFPFTKIGCSSDISLMLNDVFLNGKESDLSVLGTDLSSAKDIQIQVRDKLVTISINRKVVLTSPYRETMGKLVGVRFKFLGIGNVKSFTLYDQHENEVGLDTNRYDIE